MPPCNPMNDMYYKRMARRWLNSPDPTISEFLWKSLELIVLLKYHTVTFLQHLLPKLPHRCRKPELNPGNYQALLGSNLEHVRNGYEVTGDFGGCVMFKAKIVGSA